MTPWCQLTVAVEPDGVRTRDHPVKSRVLYQTELQALLARDFILWCFFVLK